ncbi:MAG: 16S rRNA (guanine(527)-N(7))-methyltransferase RsmG [Gammaproteobacteria bacterium]|jgi:16S rRNA (guanine527-N7)-methyltransferase|nr:16S rRNA (guanine(527)-N(7))-methyltransferase RsmG [Gammaproteobacteria bacterium]MBT7477924.1 16S rRNA (guanine(527)-N(7))-methyltransferase RsmG [Gammaproteobacteria bacterium]HIJ23228.1 16S rRNA (guanine(527)-N(7))-methyltransferase RsmG [Gammaproteobacteria bacterium]HIJ27937.1 16S rRNA (guanine(527)-N(7))-methyltransferase RsmG [Gammaproteobacteria bacterium]HIJ31320.1 16S rRNA (guanine(527)-N(7))-methyltransferase RsmG [Gammaproteobacteria bacterium]
MTSVLSMEEAAQQLGVMLAPEQQQKLEQYLDLLMKWNKVYNLTAIRGRQKMVTHHIYDSLSVIPFLQGSRLVDLGSGAGLPGIPLALLQPETEVVMVDSNVKKSRFIQQAILELSLPNASVVHSRVEQLQPEQPFDRVVSRAFTSLSQFLSLASPLLVSGGRAIAMKGRWPEEEGGEVVEGFELDQVQPVEVPGLHAERHLVICRKL